MGEQTQLEAARKIGISKSNITRWKEGARAAPDFVVKVARAYDSNVLEALVEAGFITEEEAALREVPIGGVALSDATDEQLIGELHRRLHQEDELAARRGGGRVRSGGYDDGTVRLWDESVPYAADGSVDEELVREERGEDPVW